MDIENKEGIYLMNISGSQGSVTSATNGDTSRQTTGSRGRDIKQERGLREEAGSVGEKAREDKRYADLTERRVRFIKENKEDFKKYDSIHFTVETKIVLPRYS